MLVFYWLPQLLVNFDAATFEVNTKNHFQDTTVRQKPFEQQLMVRIQVYGRKMCHIFLGWNMFLTYVLLKDNFIECYQRDFIMNFILTKSKPFRLERH